MLVSIVQRFWLFASGLLLVGGLIWQSEPVKARIREGHSTSSPRTVRPSGGTPTLSEPERVVAEGRMVAYPGAEVVVGTEVAGRIVRLPVEEKSVVRKGDLIAELNTDDLKASLAEAKARVAEAEADIRFYGRELRRDELLLARQASTPLNLDTSRRGLDIALAQKAAAAATRDRFEALIAKAQIRAPIDGVVTARHVEPGETIQASAQIVTIADLKRVRIEAEVDEFDSAHVKLGLPVTITAEGFGSASWRGTVEEIPDTVIGRRSRPEDPGRPIDSRILAVKIALGESTPLKLGQRVEVEIVDPARPSGLVDQGKAGL